jgi:cytochrome c biogenesis protein ResB
VIRQAWRGTVRFLGSTGLALGLLVFAGVWSAVASAIPQADASGQLVAAWASAHSALEPLVGTLGLHQAFTAPLFLACVALLTLCTSLCAWRRTKVAVARSRALGAAARVDGASLTAAHDRVIDLGRASGGPGATGVAGDALEGLGFRVRRTDESVRVVSPTWSVWGSPVFHWALVALAVVVLLSSLQASSGLMGIATGQAKQDTPASYGVLTAGPLHDWSAVHRSFRVDSFDTDLRIGNLDYGHAPTVSVLDANGRVVKTQIVYPNMPLQIGSLTIHAPAFGLAVTFSMVDTTGVEVASGVQLVDFSSTAASGTTSAGYLVVSDQAGNPDLKVYTTVPLERVQDGYVQALPSAPTAQVTITTVAGQVVLDSVLKPGDSVPLPTGGSLKVVSVGWYSRLSIVDDWTVPLMYVVLFVALVGLATAVFARQQYVVATVVDGPEGAKLLLSARFWRNASTTRENVVGALTKALGGVEEGSDS